MSINFKIFDAIFPESALKKYFQDLFIFHQDLKNAENNDVNIAIKRKRNLLKATTMMLHAIEEIPATTSSS